MLAVALVVGCHRRESNPSTPPGDPSAAASGAADALLTRGGALPNGDRIGEAMSRLFAHADIDAAGERLLDSLGSDPALAGAARKWFIDLFRRPELAVALAGLGESDVDATVNRAVERIGEAADDPEIRKAASTGVDRAFDHPDIDAAISRLVDNLLDHSGLEERATKLLLEWRPEIEGAVGLPMSDPQFVSAFEKHLEEQGRVDAIEEVLAHALETDPDVAAAFVGLIGSPAMFEASRSVLLELLEDPELTTDAIALLSSVVTGDFDTAAGQIAALTGGAAVVRAATAWIDKLAELDETAAIGTACAALLDRPDVRAELLTILGDTPRQRTASVERSRVPGDGPTVLVRDGRSRNEA